MEGIKIIKGQQHECSMPKNYTLSGQCRLFFFKDLLFNMSVLWPWVSPPSPHVPWAVGGVFPVSVSWCFGCMDGAWLPVCPLGGIADDLPILGMHNWKALL